MVTHSRWKNNRHSTCVVTVRHKHTSENTLTFQTRHWHGCKCARTIHANKRMYVCHGCSRAFFISSPHWCVTVQIRQWWQRCRGEGVWNWTGNYVLQLRHAVKILKAILQCLGTGCRKGDAMEGDSSIRIPGSLSEPRDGGEQGGETGQLCLIMYFHSV